MKQRTAFFSLALVIACGNANAVQAAGYVDQYNKNYISGWACDRHDSDYQVAVHIWRDDGQFLTGTAASSPRESAVAAACGSMHSNHGFAVNYSVPANLLDNKWHKVQIWIIPRIGDPQQITNSPVDIYFDSGLPPNPTDPYADAPSPRPMKDVYLGPTPAVPNVYWPRCDDYMCY